MMDTRVLNDFGTTTVLVLGYRTLLRMETKLYWWDVPKDYKLKHALRQLIFRDICRRLFHRISNENFYLPTPGYEPGSPSHSLHKNNLG